MKLNHLFGALVLSLLISGCSKGGSNFDAFLKLDTEKGVAFAVGGDDCVAKAASVGAWRKANTANYNKLREKMKEEFGKKPPEDLMKKHGAQIEINKKAVMDAMMKCSNDETFGKMMDDTSSL